MAAPPSVTMEDLSGTWMINREFTLDLTSALEIQGFSRRSRETLAAAPIEWRIVQTKEQMTVTLQTADGTPVFLEDWYLDGKPRDYETPPMGKYKMTASLARLGDVKGPDAGWLAGDWDPEDNGDGLFFKGFVDCWDDNARAWTADHVWGFEKYERKRYLVRRYVVKAKDGDGYVSVKVVFDYKGGVSVGI